MTHDHHHNDHVDDKGDTTMSPANERARIGRRQLFKYAGGAAVVAAAGATTQRWLNPFSSSIVSADTHMATIQPDRYMFLGGTDGWMGLPPTPHDPGVPPGSARGRQGSRSDDLHLRVPQHHRARRCRSASPRRRRRNTAPRCSGSRSTTLTTRPPSSWWTSPTSGWRCAPTSSMLTRSTGTASATSSRSSTASRRGRCRCPRARCSATSTGPATPAPTCTTATSKTSSTCTWA